MLDEVIAIVSRILLAGGERGSNVFFELLKKVILDIGSNRKAKNSRLGTYLYRVRELFQSLCQGA